MESESYRVEILHYLNPHLIWVEVKKSDAAKNGVDISFEQIGIYGILPMEQTIDIAEECLKTRESLVWAPGVQPLMKQMLLEATNIWFSPTYIDRRSSIFDSNIHKYGELTIKTKDGQLRKLSQMLIKTSFAYYNEANFHQNLSTFKLKTNLDRKETHIVIKALEKAYRKDSKINGESMDSKTEESFKNQTKVYQEAQNLESMLTVTNLNKHNKSLLQLTNTRNINELIENKYEDLKLCKDTDEVSVGRGTPKSKKSYDKDFLESASAIDNSFDMFNQTKEFLLKHAKNKVAEHNKEVQEQKVWDLNKSNEEIGKEVSGVYGTKSIDLMFEEYQYKKPTKGKAKNTLNKKQTPEYNSETHKIVSMGPPEIDKKKLGYVVVSKNEKSFNDVKEETEKTRELKENPLAGLDSEVDFPISKPVNTHHHHHHHHLPSSSPLPVEAPENSESIKNTDLGSPVKAFFKKFQTKTPIDTRVAKENPPSVINTGKTPVKYDKQLTDKNIGNSVNSSVSVGCSFLARENPGSVLNTAHSTLVKTDDKPIDYSPNNSSKVTPDKYIIGHIVTKNTGYISAKVKAKPSSVNSSVSSVNCNKSPRSLPKYFLNKIGRGKPDSNNDASSETDTSAKDNSSSSEANVNKYDKDNKDDHRNDSDNESTISEIVERLDLETKTTTQPKLQVTVDKTPNHKNHVNPFKNIDASISKFVDKLVSHILMVHSKIDCRIIPTYQLRDVPFNSDVFSGLASVGVKTPTMLQTVSWPTILRGNSLFMISPMNSGKTLGYVPAVCRLVADFNAEDFPECSGPICIILCATSLSTTAVEKLCRKFLGHPRKVVSCFAGVNETDVTTSLLNGCDVLVCTPPSLLRLLQVVNFAVDLTRLNTFVLDDCERLGHVYLNEIKYFILKIKEMLKKRVNRDLKVQYIAASRAWCDFMEPLAKSAPNSVVCIGSFQECVLYSKAGMSVVFASKENKMGIVLEFLNSVDKSKKTVIVCRDDKEVCDIEIMLKKVGRHVFAANSEMSVEDLHTLSNNWAEYDEPLIGAILLCCDDSLLHLNVTDAYNLLQYSLPSLFSMFSRRYSVLTDHYPSIFKTTNDEVKIKIILEGDNVEQLPKILHFLKRCTTNLPSTLDEACNTILREKDFLKAKNLMPICDNMLSLGECPDFWNCIQRHSVFKEFDAPMNQVPTMGVVTFKILHYHNAVTYSARLLANVVNGKTHKYPQNYSSLSLKLGLYYSQQLNRIPHGIPKIGDICAVSIKENFYERCQVIKIVSRYEKNGSPKEILIKLIDEEKWEKTRDIYLYNLPDQLKNVKCYVSQVKLSNLQPRDKDVTFSDIVLHHLKGLTETEDDLYMRARISMTIGNCIMVDELEACQDLSSSKQTVVRYNFRTELLKQHALPNPEHLLKLEKLCEDGGLEIKADAIVEKEDKTEIVIELPEPQWAHLEDDMQLVYFASAEDPNKFFVRLEKFEACLGLLTKDIQEYVAEDTIVAVEKVNESDIVLAKFPDDSLYYRARIDYFVDENKSKCFFVDHGDWRVVQNKDIVGITEKFITKMPFQAIECRLIGIKPFGNKWLEYSTNYFCDQCFVGNSNDLKKLYIKYFTKEISESTSGHKYGVVLIDTTTDEDIIINNMLLQRKLAEEDADEIQYLENLDFKRNEPEILEEDDEWVCTDAECKAAELLEAQEANKTNTSLLFSQPIRSVPLIASDSEGETNDWDIEFSNEDLRSVFKVASGKGPNNDTANVPALLSIESDAHNTEGTSTCSSKISDFEIIPSPKASIQELDSDDLSTPEQTALNLSIDVTPTNALKNELKELEVQRKPKLCWRQTKATVSIRIELIGVTKYDLNITDKRIKFACEVLDTKYGFEFELYGVVHPEQSSHQPNGLYIYVKLIKLLPRAWTTLQNYDHVPRKWIVYDPDSIEISSDEDDDMAQRKDDLKKLVEKAHYDQSDDEIDDETYGDDLLLYEKKIGYDSD